MANKRNSQKKTEKLGIFHYYYLYIWLHQRKFWTHFSYLFYMIFWKGQVICSRSTNYHSQHYFNPSIFVRKKSTSFTFIFLYSVVYHDLVRMSFKFLFVFSENYFNSAILRTNTFNCIDCFSCAISFHYVDSVLI